MAHLMSRLGDLLHLHPFARPHNATDVTSADCRSITLLETTARAVVTGPPPPLGESRELAESELHTAPDPSGTDDSEEWEPPEID